MRWKAFTMALTAGAAIVGSVGIAQAESIIQPTNLAMVDKGEQVRGETTTDILSAPNRNGTIFDLGDLRSNVYLNDGMYTYTFELHSNNTTTTNAGHPQHLLDDISEVNTGFDLSGAAFTGTAGYDFQQAFWGKGENNGEEFDITYADSERGDGTLDWDMPELPESFYWGGEPVTFFYQSTNAPVDMLEVNTANGMHGSGQAFVPAGARPLAAVPTPGAFAGGFALMGGLALVGYRRKKA